ncbi:hypothetical protein KY284_032607 [Solanum tuberosum]|nr:hypothetical protein KY284_032607 [Solanum tuberosum]
MTTAPVSHSNPKGKEKEKEEEEEEEKEKEQDKTKEKEKVKRKAKEKKKKKSRSRFNIDVEGPTELMSSFSQWIYEGLYKHHAKKRENDDHYLANCSDFEFKQLDFVVAFPKKKDWFYVMSQPNKCWTDEHVDVILYYLRKKSKQQSHSIPLLIVFFKTYINNASVVLEYENKIVGTIKGFGIPGGLPWHLTDEVYVPVNYNREFHWVLAVVVLKERCTKARSGYVSNNEDPQRPRPKKAKFDENVVVTTID